MTYDERVLGEAVGVSPAGEDAEGWVTTAGCMRRWRGGNVLEPKLCQVLRRVLDIGRQMNDVIENVGWRCHCFRCRRSKLSEKASRKDEGDRPVDEGEKHRGVRS